MANAVLDCIAHNTHRFVLEGQNSALAKLASPVFHVESTDPPLLLFHGEQDPQMPISQSHELTGVYKNAKLDVTFEVVYGAAFYTRERLKLVLDFLSSYLKK